MGAGDGEMRVQLVIRRLCGRPAWNNNVIPCTENNRGIVAPPPRRAPRWPRRFTTPWKWKGNAVRSPSRYGSIPTSGKRSPTACLMLGQRRRRWPNIEHAVGQRQHYTCSGWEFRVFREWPGDIVPAPEQCWPDATSIESAICHCPFDWAGWILSFV